MCTKLNALSNRAEEVQQNQMSQWYTPEEKLQFKAWMLKQEKYSDFEVDRLISLSDTEILEEWENDDE